MHRAGFSPANFRQAFARLQACAGVGDIVLMSHMACADEPKRNATASQIQLFDEASAGLTGDRSLANSAAVLAWPEARRDWGRLGIALYGVDPIGAGGVALEPVMTLQSEVFDVRELVPGETLGYGATYVADRHTRVGLVAIGYADGYPRSVAPETPVAVNSRLATVIGRVSMDMLTVDLTDITDAGIGSQVELWGKQVNVGDVAALAGTISYEVICHLQRVPRIFIN